MGLPCNKRGHVIMDAITLKENETHTHNRDATKWRRRKNPRPVIDEQTFVNKSSTGYSIKNIPKQGPAGRRHYHGSDLDYRQMNRRAPGKLNDS